MPIVCLEANQTIGAFGIISGVNQSNTRVSMDGWMTCDISGIEDMYHIVNRWPCHVHCHTLYHLGGNCKKKKIQHNIFHPEQELP